ncbi:MAG: YbbR-like domain-containing protein [Breznakia sp.]
MDKKSKDRNDYKKLKDTYTSVEASIISAFSFVSKWVDRILFNQKYGKIVAVCLASMLCLIITSESDSNIFTNSLRSAMDLGPISVSANISTSEYEVTGLPESVDVSVMGDASDVQYASQQKANYQVIADLTELGEGTHEVVLEPLNFSGSVSVTLSQNTANVTIRKKIAKAFSFTYDFTNTNQMDKIYSLEKPNFSSSEVLVKASEETMAQISYIKALIDVSGVKADFEQDARLVAYDYEGNKMEVDILPQTVSAKVSVSSPRKEVAIKVEVNGELEDNKAIAAYTIDQKKMTIYGPQEVLDEVDEVLVEVPVNKLKGDSLPITVTVPIMLPEGVRKGSVTKVNISLTLEDAKTKKIDRVSIAPKGLSKALQLDGTIEPISVAMKGSAKNMESLNANNIKLEVDLANISEVGEYSVEVTVVNKHNLVVYTLGKTEITIKVKKKE